MTTNSANTANTAIAKEAVETNGAQSQQTDPPTLQLDNVSYAYTKGGKRVLKNISHDSQAGKVHAITGPSGAGKTTLLSLISGLANPTEGMVLVDGTDLSERDRYRFRSHDIGVIFQSFNLLPMFTAEQNIECYIGVPAAWHADFALTCHGSSMAPTICDGDIVCIRCQPEVEQGEIAAVRIGDEATLKHFHRQGDTVMLLADNAAVCPPMIYAGPQLNEIQIEGRAVGFCRGL